MKKTSKIQLLNTEFLTSEEGKDMIKGLVTWSARVLAVFAICLIAGCRMFTIS